MYYAAKFRAKTASNLLEKQRSTSNLQLTNLATCSSVELAHNIGNYAPISLLPLCATTMTVLLTLVTYFT